MFFQSVIVGFRSVGTVDVLANDLRAEPTFLGEIKKLNNYSFVDSKDFCVGM